MTEETKDFIRFSLLGALGGLGAFLLSHFLQVGPFAGKPWQVDLPVELLLGAFAALFGVYLLTASDVKAPRTMIFALACGLFWSPIISGIKSSMDKIGDQAAVKASKAAKTLANQSLSQPADQAQQSVKTATLDITSAIDKLPSISSVSSQEAIVNNSKSVVTSLAHPDKADSTTVEALKNIGLASQNRAPEIRQFTLDSLTTIAKDSPNPQTRLDASQAAFNVNDPSNRLNPYAPPEDPRKQWANPYPPPTN